jgi:hypothetical protein
MLTFSSRPSRRWTLIALLALGATFLNSVPAKAAAATQVDLGSLATEMVAARDISPVTVTMKDGGDATDTGYTGVVTLSSNNCADSDPCLEVSATANPFTPLANQSYTFNNNQIPMDNGTKQLFVRWTEDGVGTQRLHASAPGLTPDDAPNETEVLSNLPTILDMNGVEAQRVQGDPDAFTIDIKNDAGQTHPSNYEGTVVFTSSCGNCFTVEPHDAGTGNEKQYTFVPGDNGSKGFTLTWGINAIGNDRTFTATDENLDTTPSETMSGIDITGSAATSTTSSTSSTTSTSTSTTSTTAVPRTKASRVVTGAGAGGGPHVIVRNAANPGNVLFSFMAYDPNFTGGVRVATGDVNGDGYDDIITAAGPGGGPHVQVFNGKDAGAGTPSILRSFMAYGQEFTGGVFVASADVNNDGKDDIITGPDAGGGPHVRVWSGADGAEIKGFMAYGQSWTGGVRVASGDFDGDGRADVMTAPGPGGGPHVRVFDGTDASEIFGIMAYAPNFTGGVFLAADRADEGIIYTGAGPGGGRHVKLFDIDGELEGGFIASLGTQGAIPAVGESTGLASDVFVVSRAVSDSGVQFFSLDPNDNFEELPGAFSAYGAGVGVYIAVGVL